MAPEESKFIEIKDLYKVYRVGSEKIHALDGISLTIEEGEFCAVVGTSGSGKSTLLNMLAGLEPPTKGSIKIGGREIVGLKENQLVAFRREHVGFIFQSFNLIPTMTAKENVALPLTFQGVPKVQRNKRALALLKLTGLYDHRNHKPNQLSGGQQQRVGISRALVVEPEIIFADEPTGNLDSATSAEILTMMRRISREKNQTIIMVTHDDHLARFADRIIRISYGLSYLINYVAGVYINDMESMGYRLSLIPPWLSLGALAFSILIGVLSGLMPALRAMRLSPLEALRNQ
jgi:putative ABC transport system ATP-binding protein